MKDNPPHAPHVILTSTVEQLKRLAQTGYYLFIFRLSGFHCKLFSADGHIDCGTGDRQCQYGNVRGKMHRVGGGGEVSVMTQAQSSRFDCRIEEVQVQEGSEF